MLPIKKIRWLTILLAILFLAGCLPKKQPEISIKTEKAKLESAETEPENPMDKIAVLELSTPKSQYKSNEPILIKLTMNIGKFHLPVEKSAVEDQRAFSGLIVKDANGKIVKPQKPLSKTRIIKKIYQNGKLRRCVEGITLSNNETVSVSLKDLRKFYSLEPGKYSLQVIKSLKVYHDNFVAETSPEIARLEEEISSIKSDPVLSDRAKGIAIERLKQDVASLKSKIKKKENGKKFLPIDSLRGRAVLKSNTIEITISSSPMTEEEIQEVEEKIQEEVELTKPTEEKAEIPVMKIRLSSPKLAYAPGESLPLELVITDISRDLPVARSAVYGQSIFSGLVVKDANGNLIEPKKSISSSRIIKKLYYNGKLVKCVQGLKLSQGDRIFVPLYDLSKFYSLKPGRYSLQLITKFKIYSDEFLIEKPQSVIEYEREIEAIKKDKKLSEGAKKDAIANLKKEIEFQMSKFTKGKQKKYLALDAVEEKAEISSNEIQIQITSK